MVKLTTMSRVNAYLEEMIADGWALVRNHKHLVITSSDNQTTIMLPKTAKDKSSTARNVLAKLKRKRREHDEQWNENLAQIQGQ